MRLGSTTINKAYLGSTQINKIYVGATEVFGDTGGGGSPLIAGAFTANSLTPTEGNNLVFTFVQTSVNHVYAANDYSIASPAALVLAAASSLTYQLNKDGSPVSGATSVINTLTAVDETDDGDYTLVVTDPNTGHSVTFGPLAIAVIPTPEPPDPTSTVRLLFSDLTHAPKSGWSAAEPNKGAAVTVWARDFGGVRGSNFISVNGVDLTDDTDYAEWNVDSYDHIHLKRTTFWLKSTMTDGAGFITATIGGDETNALPFTIISGNIYFTDKDHGSAGSGTLTDPWSNPGASGRGVRALQPGDILYFRETTTPYASRYLGGRQNFYLSGLTPGTSAAPIACVAYPGETPECDALTLGTADVCWALLATWWTLSKFRLTALYHCIAMNAQGTRAVGNDCSGCTVFGTGVGIIFTFAGEHDVFGNTAHGGTTANKLDHAIYISGNPSSVRGAELAYNYVYDNNFAEGPMMVINHQSNRIPAGLNCKEHRIHSNWIDCSNFPSRAIGIYHMGWEVGNPNGEAEPETALIYNNIVIDGGSVAGDPVFYQVNGKAKWFNNTIIDGHGRALLAGDTDVISCEFVNNLVQMVDGAYLTINAGSGSMVIDNNLWHGAGSAPAQDLNAISATPDLDVNYAPLVTSPCVDAGADTSSVVAFDYYSNPRDLSIDIGAVEYVA
jgi:hypothetical protein